MAATRAQTDGPPAGAKCKVKLPKLELQRFSGAATEWQSFWEQFEQAVHGNDGLSNVEKFLYLRSVLSGKAAAAIAGIQVTGANYTTVIELLKERFGRRDVPIQEHLTQLLELPPVQNEKEHIGLRRLYDHLQRHIAGLTALGVKTDSYGALLSSALLRMLPTDLVVEYYKGLSAASKDDAISIKSLQAFLKTEVESREKALQAGNLAARESKHRDKEKSKPQKGSAASLFSAGTSKLSDPCAFCAAKDHATHNCQAKISLDEKKKRLTAAGRCFRCCIKGHTSRECRNKRIKCKQCGRRHLTQMCDPTWKPPENKATELHSWTKKKSEKVRTVLLQTAQVWAEARRRALTRLLFDGGSQRSFVTKRLSGELQLEVVGEEDITIYPFGGAGNIIKEKRRRVKIWLRSQYDRKEHSIEALEIPEICSDRLHVPEDILKEVQADMDELADMTVAPAHLMGGGIDILIGADYYWTLVCGEVKKLQGALVAVKTEFGWTLQGAIPSSSSAAYCSTVAVLRAGVFADTTSLSKELKSFWELESIGIIDSCAQTSEESEEVMSTFSASVEKMNKRYEVALLWKPLNMQLADNKAVAKKRLTNLTKKLMKDDSTLIKYDEAIRQYLDHGFAERLPSQESNNDVNRLYYMPHRAVFRPDSLSTKIRVVFDASSHDAGCISLNEALEPGPNSNPDLLKVLLNFRIHRIGLSADIEKAFLQISVQPADRAALRFLWYAHLPTKEDPEPPIEVWRMTRVPFGVTSSPFLLAATVRHHLSTTGDYPQIRKTIGESLYVDDLITGANTVEEATDFYRGALDVMNRASMTLRKWNSNSKKLQQLFNDEGSGCALGYVECPTTSVSRVLELVRIRTEIT
ncbi:uncharacterized protein [Dermacentor albipictus]|uniref:uncharacterized protein n=1 Tax=Dermacentor albipictus TaxID=60249 RepID=UPI0038FCC314